MGAPIEPSPKRVRPLASKDGWAITSSFSVPLLQPEETPTLFDTLVHRRTRRECEPLALNDVLSLLQFAMQTREFGEGDNAGRLRKVSVSAGALHSIEVLVVSGPEVSEPIIYSDKYDTFGTVQFRSPDCAIDQIDQLMAIAPQAKGHLILLVANLRHVSQAYEQPISLLWRDSGAVLQTFSLLSTALGYAFVPLGPTGGSLLETVTKPHDDYVAVGAGIIGKAPIQADGASV